MQTNKKTVDERLDELRIRASQWIIRWMKPGDELVRMSQPYQGSDVEKVERFPYMGDQK